MTSEIFRKTTGKGAVLVVSLDGGRLSATVDGKAIDATLKILDAPKAVNGNTVVSQMGPIGLTMEEHRAIDLARRGPEPKPVDAKYEHARPYTDEDRAWDRGFEKKHHGE